MAKILALQARGAILPATDCYRVAVGHEGQADVF